MTPPTQDWYLADEDKEPPPLTTTDPAVEAVMRVLGCSQWEREDGDTCRVHEYDASDLSVEWTGETCPVAREVVAALDPVIRKAKAEALREAAAEFEDTWGQMSEAGPLDVTRWVRERADRIEADPDA